MSEEIYGPRLEPRCAEAQVLNLLITPVIVLFFFFSLARVMCATAPARPSQGAADRDVGPRVVKRTHADVRRKPAKSQPQTRKVCRGGSDTKRRTMR